MKYVLIGDVHGRTNWKKIIEKEKDADKVIFHGDYFDPYDWTLTVEEITRNFREILQLKKDNPNKFVLLVGNHDLRSFNQNANECRYIDGTFEAIGTEFYNGIKEGLIQLCYFIESKVVCSHAGFTKTWLNDAGLEFDEFLLNKDFKEQVEYKTVVSTYDFIYNRNDGWPDMSGNNHYQGPLWVRPQALMFDKVPVVIQCIGHSRINKNSKQDPVRDGILLVDCLEHDEYYIYENNEFKFNKI